MFGISVRVTWNALQAVCGTSPPWKRLSKPISRSSPPQEKKMRRRLDGWQDQGREKRSRQRKKGCSERWDDQGVRAVGTPRRSAAERSAKEEKRSHLDKKKPHGLKTIFCCVGERRRKFRLKAKGTPRGAPETARKTGKRGRDLQDPKGRPRKDYEEPPKGP